ncbi:MAG: M81 family metallopeptidase [Planctomycetes bacterium]|nr:M81 family metallopeptidase [Planctomycetota bacterium]
MRVGVIAFLHESNTFISRPTTLRHFEKNLLARGEEVRRRLAGSHHETAGFLEELEAAGVEAVPIFAARATPYGTIDAETFATLLAMMQDDLDRAGELDGLLAAPHGATVSESHSDADGHWLSLMRTRLGPDKPLVATLDSHADLSQAMVEATDALVAYRTNPHVDQRERGREAARLLVRSLRGEVRLTQAAAMPAMAMDIERQCTSEWPCKPLYEMADEILSRPGVRSNSILLGFPYADVAEMGSATVVVTDDDRNLAQRLANELGGYLWEHRREFVGEHLGIEPALDQAQAMPGRVCLLDMGDNVGGGSPGDGALLARAIHERGIADSFVCLCDPEAVGAAEVAGAGSHLKLSVGGKTDRLHGEPLEADFAVVSLHEGKFRETQARHGGWTDFDMDRTAVVRSDRGMTIMLTTNRTAPFSLEQLRSCGLDPAAFRLLAAKGVNAPIAAYEEVCDHFLRVNTPGVTTADMTRLTFHRRRRPMFPFEAI